MNTMKHHYKAISLYDWLVIIELIKIKIDDKNIVIILHK